MSTLEEIMNDPFWAQQPELELSNSDAYAEDYTADGDHEGDHDGDAR